MSGRPKAGNKPKCVKRGACLAVRKRSGDKHSDTGCRNCAQTFLSVDDWIERFASIQSMPACLKRVYTYAKQHQDQNPFKHVNTWFFLSCLAQLSPHILIDSFYVIPLVAQYSFEQRPSLLQWVYTSCRLESLPNTFQLDHPSCIEDFIFCARHTPPSYRCLKELLQQLEFQKAATRITTYEQNHGIRLKNARAFYNQHVKLERKKANT